ncbi:MAG: replication-relaxation family protein [Actinobacteria bacterium]|nr:replication-relaxation family protein [Actinomycetota bacterium]
MLRTRHICALLFTAGTKLSSVRICRRVLRELHQQGLLHRERPVAAKSGGGSEDAVWALTAAGQRLLALGTGESPRRLRRPEERGTSGRRHLLAIADLRVALTRAARDRGVALSWQGEPACWWRFRSERGEELLKPDCYIEMAGSRRRRIAWVELDIGTQTVSGAVQAKLRRYCRAARARRAAGDPVPRVLIVSELPTRRERIAELAPRFARKEGIDAATARALFSAVDEAAAVEELVRC